MSITVKFVPVLAATLCGCVVAGSATRAATPHVETAQTLIQHFEMQRVPQEGIWFSPTYVSEDRIVGSALPPRYAGQARTAGNAIVVVATHADFSAMHRLRTDETWHFYSGSPLELLLLYPDGHGRVVMLGAAVLAGQLRQFTVPQGVWQGAIPRRSMPGAYSFAATQLSPGFDYADFEIGYRDDLVHRYPAFRREIEGRTRAEFLVKPVMAPLRPQS